MAEDIYPYRPNFKEAVKDLRTSKKVTLTVVAGWLGLELETLHDYLYKPHMRPGREPLKKLSKLTGRSMSDFDDDPGAPPEGATEDSTESQKFMLRVMGSDMSKLTPARQAAAFDAWRAMVRGYEKE